MVEIKDVEPQTNPAGAGSDEEHPPHLPNPLGPCPPGHVSQSHGSVLAVSKGPWVVRACVAAVIDRWSRPPAPQSCSMSRFFFLFLRFLSYFFFPALFFGGGFLWFSLFRVVPRIFVEFSFRIHARCNGRTTLAIGAWL